MGTNGAESQLKSFEVQRDFVKVFPETCMSTIDINEECNLNMVMSANEYQIAGRDDCETDIKYLFISKNIC